MLCSAVGEKKGDAIAKCQTRVAGVSRYRATTVNEGLALLATVAVKDSKDMNDFRRVCRYFAMNPMASMQSTTALERLADAGMKMGTPEFSQAVAYLREEIQKMPNGFVLAETLSRA